MPYNLYNGQDINGLFGANADLSAKQFYVVCVVAGPLVDVVGAATTAPFGILLNNPKAGLPCQVLPLIPGKVCEVVSHDTSLITVGTKVMAFTDGTVILATTNSGLNYCIGYCLETPAAGGNIISVLLSPDKI